MARGADRPSVDGGMVVRDVGADGYVDRHRDSRAVRGGDQAIPAEASARITGEKTPDSLPDPESQVIAECDGLINIAARFFGHAEASRTQRPGDVLRSCAGQRDLEIVDQRRAVHRHSVYVSALQQVDQDRGQPALDGVPAEPPDDRLAPRA